LIFDRPRAAVTIGGFCAFIDLYAPQAVLPQLADSLHISPASAGTTIGISTLAIAMSAPVVGMLADRLGNKTTILAASLLLIVPTLLLVVAGSLNQILLLRFLQGLLLPAIFSPLVAYVSEEWPPAQAADIMGVYVAGTAVGGFSGRFVTALMADQFGWRAGFALLAVLTLAGSLIVWAWLPAARRPHAGRNRVSLLAGAVGHLRNPLLLATYAAGFALLFAMVAAFTYVNFHLAAPPYGLSAAQLGMIFLVYLIGAAVAPASGYFVRRLHRRKAMVMAIGLGCAGMALTLSSSLAVIVAGLALFVTGVFLAQSLAMGFVGQAARTAKATAVGIYVCIYYLGGSAGAVVPGLVVWHVAGWPGCVILILAVMCVSAAIAWHAWPSPVPAPAAE
jgi:MFS transporter, YNFM family, putative membrane transport protein